MTETSMFKRAKAAVGRLVFATGVDLRLHTPGRKTFEQVILPYFRNAAEFHRILFVGCDWYTRGYQKVFASKDYWTLEIDPDHARFGAHQHIVDSVTHLQQHFAPERFDVIFFNGVFGWGLNDPDAIEQAFDACYRTLRPQGVLVFGWNDTPEHRPVALQSIASLRQFSAATFPPLQSVQGLVAESEMRQMYDFFVK